MTDLIALARESGANIGATVIVFNLRDFATFAARIAKAPEDERTQFLQMIVALSAGWDENGSLGPRPPLSWETVGRMAMDYANAALKAAPSALAAKGVE